MSPSPIPSVDRSSTSSIAPTIAVPLPGFPQRVRQDRRSTTRRAAIPLPAPSKTRNTPYPSERTPPTRGAPIFIGPAETAVETIARVEDRFERLEEIYEQLARDTNPAFDDPLFLPAPSQEPATDASQSGSSEEGDPMSIGARVGVNIEADVAVARPLEAIARDDGLSQDSSHPAVVGFGGAPSPSMVRSDSSTTPTAVRGEAYPAAVDTVEHDIPRAPSLEALDPEESTDFPLKPPVLKPLSSTEAFHDGRAALSKNQSDRIRDLSALGESDSSPVRRRRTPLAFRGQNGQGQNTHTT